MKMKKAAIITLTIGGVFLSGTVVQAQYDWLNPILNDAVVKMHSKAQTKTDTLVSNLKDGIGNLMADRARPEIDQKGNEIQQELDAYYQQKLQTLDNTDEYKELEKDLDIIKQQTLDMYKKQIDDAFSGK